MTALPGMPAGYTAVYPKSLRRVFIVWRPWLAPLQWGLARELARRGVEISVYTTREPSAVGLRRQDKDRLFARVVAAQVLYDSAAAECQSEETEIARARAHEEWLGKTYGELALSDRHLGRGFALGGPLFPVSDASHASYAQMLAAFSTQIEFWQAQLEQLRPDLILDGGLPLAFIAEQMRIPIRIVCSSRHKNLHYWATDVLFRSGEIARAYDAARASANAPSDVQHEPSPQIQFAMKSFYKTALKQAKLSYLISAGSRFALERAGQRILRRDLGPTYTAASTIAYLARQWRNTRHNLGGDTKALSDIGDRPFVFFPLATEPETSLQVLSPEYFFQLETIALVARDLPAGVRLAVKEHYLACGARSRLFYDQIKAFKNVVILDMREPGIEACKQAAATVTISGSAGFEAALFGKPVILFGRNNIFDVLDHVRVIRDPAELKAAIGDALSGRLAKPSARRDAAVFLRALEQISFDLGTYTPFEPSTASDASVEQALRCLLRSLSFHAAEAAPL